VINRLYTSSVSSSEAQRHSKMKRCSEGCAESVCPLDVEGSFLVHPPDGKGVATSRSKLKQRKKKNPKTRVPVRRYVS
jgi:hypothetical protein